jgi:quercetin dioxygenase-like cupin family protein
MAAVVDNRGIMEPKKLMAVDPKTLPWEEVFNEPTGKYLYRRSLVTDPDTGMEIKIVRYPAGFTNPLHTHHCAHGMYVLEGTLKTHEGSYGPGSFLWFPEGMTMEHGATAKEDVVILFITNKPFDIQYL